MREFFRGWKRKVGTLTLVIACVFAGLWVRSFSIYETFNVPLGNDKYVQFAFADKKLLFGWLSIKRTGERANGKLNLWVTDSDGQKMWTEFKLDGSGSRTNLEIANGMSRANLSNNNGAEYFIDHQYRAVPCWSIGIPLTIFSAYLLLSRPRPASNPSPRRPCPPRTSLSDRQLTGAHDEFPSDLSRGFVELPVHNKRIASGVASGKAFVWVFVTSDGKGWKRFNQDPPEPFEIAGNTSEHVFANFVNLEKLTDPGVKLIKFGTENVRGKDAIGIQVNSDDLGEVSFYLLKSAMTTFHPRKKSRMTLLASVR